MFKTLILITGTACFIACGTNTASNGNTTSGISDTTTNPPVEKDRPNTSYKPAFAGQTRIGGVKTTTLYEGRTISTSLNKPWGIVSLPDGRLLITQKAGTMVIASTDGQVSQPISGLPSVDAKGQGGLLGVTIDPDFTTNRMVYWTFTEKVAGGNHTAAAKGKLSADDSRMENVQVVYRATPTYDGSMHYGSRILVDRSGNLVISTGERSDLETRPQAQDLNSALGKIIRITKEGKPATGNPFSGGNSGRQEIYSYGHRNPQGLALHPVTGDIWNSEMGPRGGDEINRAEAGKNYGWPTITYGIEYSGAKINNGKTQQSGMEQPVYYWDPVLSPSGMTFYSGDAIPEWKNNLFICGLNSKHIARIVIENNKVTGEERLLEGEGRFRDITQGKDGALYAVTDEGKLFRIGRR